MKLLTNAFNFYMCKISLPSQNFDGNHSGVCWKLSNQVVKMIISKIGMKPVRYNYIINLWKEFGQSRELN